MCHLFREEKLYEKFKYYFKIRAIIYYEAGVKIDKFLIV